MNILESKKVLIVDDEPNIVLALKFLLDEEGYDVICGYNGQEALQLMEMRIPDLVILDVMMPDIDGFSVAKKIRQNPNYDKTSIIFLTAKGASNDKMEGYNAGAEIYIVKPFDNDEMLEKVQEAMNVNNWASD